MSERETSASLRRKLYLLVVALLLLLGLALAWSSTPMRAWLDVDRAVESLRRFGQAFGPLAAVGGFALALTLAVPLVFLTLIALVAYGPMVGFGCAMGGALLAAAASYGVGRFLGREVVQRLGGERINRLSQRLASRGLLAVVAVRLLPVAPFAVVNMVAGASHIRLRDLMLGTLIGISPGDHRGAATSDAADIGTGRLDHGADRVGPVGDATLVAHPRPAMNMRRLTGWPLASGVQPRHCTQRLCLVTPAGLRP
jgi:uncharacterized membrane protein YdjX (TVP38/TMEM64 family)